MNSLLEALRSPPLTPMSLAGQLADMATAKKRRRPKGIGAIGQRGETFAACWFTIDPATRKRQQLSKDGFAPMDATRAHVTTVLADVRRGTSTAPSA